MGMLGCILIKLFDIMNVCNILWPSPISILPRFFRCSFPGYEKEGEA